MPELCQRATNIAATIARIHKLGAAHDLPALRWLRYECLSRDSGFERNAILSVVNTYLKPDMHRPDWVIGDGRMGWSVVPDEDDEDE